MIAQAVASADPSPSSTPVVPLVSAEAVHRYLVEAFRIGNRARLRFARLLAGLQHSRHYLTLGHPSVSQYAEQHFGMQRTETYECIRVAEGIDDLPGCREAFEAGRLSWSALKLITRVATAETEGEWLAFAAERGFTRLRAEVQDARRKNRTRPRADRYGLPNVTVKFTVELTREEDARLAAALEKAGAELAPSLGQQRLEARDVLLYMAERFLRTDPEGTPAGRTERSDTPVTILYHQCPTCRKARVMTGEGPVAVPPERVERLAGSARTVVLEDEEDGGGAPEPEAAQAGPAPEPDGGAGPEAAGKPAAGRSIDRPNPAALALKVKLRDGGVCQNPGCRDRGDLHAHHLEHRARGGRTIATNECALCRMCHALVHAGLLEVSGDPFTGLRFTPRSATLDIDPGEEAGALAEVPVVRLPSAVADASPPPGAFVPEEEIAALGRGLMRLGYTRAEAHERLERAAEELRRRGEPWTESRLITCALPT